MKTFSDLDLSQAIVEVTKELGYSEMTAIQTQSIPILMKGKDVIGQSKTGSGKTAAFSIPILEKIKIEHRGLQALILCPTRELCAQVAREVRRLGRKLPGLHVAVLSGGSFIAPQLLALEKGAQIAVATPGRFMDILERKKLDSKKIKTIVLDEADRMLDMGFEEAMEYILSMMPESRQTVLFSATFPDTIEALSKRYQKDPVRVTVSSTDMDQIPIEQKFCYVNDDQRVEVLKTVLKKLNPSTAIVFCNLKAVVAETAEELKRSGFSADAIHGDLEQFDRDRVMAKFRNNSTTVLVATDVAARGIDIQGLDLVVNYDTPAKPDVYVHRIGRTGRAGKPGLAVSLLAQRERHKLDRIADETKKPSQVFLLEEITKSPIVRTEKNSKDEDKPSSPQKMSTICIYGGRKDKLRPGDILGALTGSAGGFKGSDIGKIEIHDRLTYVAVNSEIVDKVVDSLSKGQIKKEPLRLHIQNKERFFDTLLTRSAISV